MRSGRGRTSSRLAKEKRSREGERVGKGLLLETGRAEVTRTVQRREAGEHGNRTVYAAAQIRTRPRLRVPDRRVRKSSAGVKGLGKRGCVAGIGRGFTGLARPARARPGPGAPQRPGPEEAEQRPPAT